jgi:serine/threonine protein kinase
VPGDKAGNKDEEKTKGYLPVSMAQPGPSRSDLEGRRARRRQSERHIEATLHSLDLRRQGIQSIAQFMALQPGTRLGSFEVLGPLGAGGMGEVYRARDTRLDRDVAIKVLPESFARDPARAARFDREARLLAAINHPAIGAIYGAEEFDSLRCIIMELVPGETRPRRSPPWSGPARERLAAARRQRS